MIRWLIRAFYSKTTPGVHHLSIREGRGRDIYELESVGAQGWDSPACTKTGAATFSVQSFSGLTLYPRFLRKPGMEKEDVLETLRPPPPSFLLNVYSKCVLPSVSLSLVSGSNALSSRQSHVPLCTQGAGAYGRSNQEERGHQYIYGRLGPALRGRHSTPQS